MQHEVSELYRSLHFICNIFLNSSIRQILRYINHQGNIQSEHKRRCRRGCICIQSCYCCFARAHILSCCWFLWRRRDCSTTITRTTAKRRICRTILCCTACCFVTVFTFWEIILKIPYDNRGRKNLEKKVIKI